MPQWFCWYMRSGSAADRTSLWTQKPTSSCSRGQSARSPLLRGAHEVPLSLVSNSPTPWTIAQKRESSSPSNMSADRPRWPGGWLAGSSQPSLPGSPASVESSPHVEPPSRLSKIPGASTPARIRPASRRATRSSTACGRRPRTRSLRSRATTSRRGPGSARRPSRATRCAGGVDRPRRRIEDRVVDGPALAVRPTQLPVAAVAVALQDEAALAGSDQQQCPCQRLTSEVGVGLVLLDGPRARDSSLICAMRAYSARPGATVRRGRLAQLGEHLPYTSEQRFGRSLTVHHSVQ